MSPYIYVCIQFNIKALHKQPCFQFIMIETTGVILATKYYIGCIAVNMWCIVFTLKNITLMKLKLIQIKQNGAKEDSQGEKKWVFGSWRFLRTPDLALVSTRSHFCLI